jgi:ArsR family transcriptional regulator
MDKQNMLTDEMSYDLADFFKLFGDSTRIKILYALYQHEMNVSDMVDVVDMTQSAISHQLRLLRQNDIVKFRKEGKAVIYSLDDEHVAALLKMGIEHIRHKNGYEEEENV